MALDVADGPVSRVLTGSGEVSMVLAAAVSKVSAAVVAMPAMGLVSRVGAVLVFLVDGGLVSRALVDQAADCSPPLPSGSRRERVQVRSRARAEADQACRAAPGDRPLCHRRR